MITRRTFGLALVGLSFIIIAVAGAVRATEANIPTAAPVRVGMVGSLFTDIPPALVNLIAPSFAGLLKEFTGIDGQMVTGGDALQVGRELAEGKLQLAVFHGVEFGWAQQRHPELRPLMIAISKHSHLQANFVVKKDSAIASIADLKGKDVSLPKRSKDHCRLFLDKSCRLEGAAGAKGYFSQVVSSASVETALDDVCRGIVPSAVIDSVSLEWYNELKPGCFARLKVIKQSETFPAAVIAFRQGAVQPEMLNKFRDGMVTANKSPKGRSMMNMFMISSFEPVPADYAQVLSEILKSYPAPVRN